MTTDYKVRKEKTTEVVVWQSRAIPSTRDKWATGLVGGGGGGGEGRVVDQPSHSATGCMHCPESSRCIFRGISMLSEKTLALRDWPFFAFPRYPFIGN